MLADPVRDVVDVSAALGALGILLGEAGCPLPALATEGLAALCGILHRRLEQAGGALMDQQRWNHPPALAVTRPRRMDALEAVAWAGLDALHTTLVAEGYILRPVRRRPRPDGTVLFRFVWRLHTGGPHVMARVVAPQ